MSKVDQCPDPVTNGVACSIITSPEATYRVETARYHEIFRFRSDRETGYITRTSNPDDTTGMILSDTIDEAQRAHAHTVTAICSMLDKNL